MRIKPCVLARVTLQQLARRKFLIHTSKRFELIDNFFQTEMLRETQRPTTDWRETCPEDHSVIGVLGGVDDVLFETTRRFVYHEEHEPVRQFLAT